MGKSAVSRCSGSRCSDSQEGDDPASASSTSTFLSDTKSRAQDNPHHTATSPRFWLAAFLLFSILDVVLFGLLIQVSVELSQLDASLSEKCRDNSSQPLPEDSSFCLPCSRVYLTQIEVLQNRFRVTKRKDEENHLLCCAQAHDDLKTLVGRMFSMLQYTRDRAQGLVTLLNDTHLSMDDRSDVNRHHLLLTLDTQQEAAEFNGTDKVPLKLWKRAAPARPTAAEEEEEQEGAETVNNSVILQNGIVRISRAGQYYIHSQVPFQFTSPPVILSQYVVRVRNGGETLLLHNSMFPCDVSLPSLEHSFAGGLFLLEQEDEVALRVSNHSSVKQNTQLQFGVHRV